jgi:anti-sigma regulatory factor (Ser/Thr protein kinase)
MLMATELHLDLPRSQDASGIAREQLTDRLADELSRQDLDDLLLVVTELVNNAVVHGEGSIGLALRVDGGRVHGEVVDDGGGFERQVRRRGVEEVGGRGLAIVEQVTSRWGIHEGTTHVWFELGTHVWFELNARSSSEPATPPELGEDRRPQALDDVT